MAPDYTPLHNSPALRDHFPSKHHKFFFLAKMPESEPHDASKSKCQLNPIYTFTCSFGNWSDCTEVLSAGSSSSRFFVWGIPFESKKIGRVSMLYIGKMAKILLCSPLVQSFIWTFFLKVVTAYFLELGFWWLFCILFTSSHKFLPLSFTFVELVEALRYIGWNWIGSAIGLGTGSESFKNPFFGSLSLSAGLGFVFGFAAASENMLVSSVLMIFCSASGPPFCSGDGFSSSDPDYFAK